MLNLNHWGTYNPICLLTLILPTENFGGYATAPARRSLTLQIDIVSKQHPRRSVHNNPDDHHVVHVHVDAPAQPPPVCGQEGEEAVGEEGIVKHDWLPAVRVEAAVRPARCADGAQSHGAWKAKSQPYSQTLPFNRLSCLRVAAGVHWQLVSASFFFVFTTYSYKDTRLRHRTSYQQTVESINN